MRTKPYCKAPWVGLSYEGTLGCKPCCEWKGDHFFGTYTQYLESDYLKNFKELMFEDEMHDHCMECIHDEKINKISRRQKHMQYDIGDGLVRLDYRPGNKCNMKCRMCGPHSSSLWEDELGDYMPKLDTSDVYDIDFSSLKKVMILGGEPSVDLEVRKFLDSIKDLDCHVGVTTNATNSSDKWFNTLKQLKKLEIDLSIDATGDIADYQRKGGEWSKIKKNIIKYRDTFRNVCIHLTATAITFPVLDRWWDELMSFNIRVFFGQVHWPITHNLDAIPDEFKEEQIAWLDNWAESIKDEPDFGHMNPLSHEELEIYRAWKFKHEAVAQAKAILGASKYNDNYNKQFKDRTKELDNIRNESILDLDYRFEEIMNEG